jgi:hypothetical protein
MIAEDDCHLEATAKDLCPGGAAKVSEILRFTQDAMVSRDMWFSLIGYHSADRVCPVKSKF